MTGLAAAAAALAAWLVAAPRLAVERRLTAGATNSEMVLPARREAVRTGLVEGPLARTVVCVCSGAAVGAVVAGLATALVGACVGGIGSWLIARLEPPSVRRRRESIESDLPLAIELLVACALAGRPVDASVDVVSSAIGGPLGEVLSAHTSRLRLGADPIAEWRQLRADPQLGPLARSMLRSLESGAPLADSLERLAAETQRARSVALQKRARTVGVRAAGPLGLCFLPAFMLVGIVPTVVGGFAHLVL